MDCIVCGCVFDIDGVLIIVYMLYCVGMLVCYFCEVVDELVIFGEVCIVYMDEYLLVVDKLLFLLVILVGVYVI